MKILFLNRWVGCHVGGTENHIKGLAYRLAKRGHIIHILTTRGSELNQLRSKVGIWEVSTNRGELPYSRGIKEDPFLIFYAILFLVKVFARILQMRLHRIKPDVVSVHCTLEALFMLFFRKILNVKVLFVLEGYTWIEAWLARYADYCVAISESLSDKCRDNFRYKPQIIPVGVDRKIFRPDGPTISSQKGQILVLSVSRLSTHKRIDVLIEAIKILNENPLGDRIKVLIVGEGKDKLRLVQMVKAKGLLNKIVFIGKIADLDLPKYYRSADIFINCESAPDEFWITCQEAISCGVPVIWTSSSEFNNQNIIRKWGLVVPLGRADLLVKAIDTLVKDSNLRSSLINRGLELSKYYDWERVELLYEEAYKETVCRHERIDINATY